MSAMLSKDGTKRLRTSYFSAVLSIALVLFMTGLLATLVLDARKLSNYVREHIQLTVYLKDDVHQAEVDALEQLVRNAAFAKSVRYVSKEAALDSLKKELGEEAFGMLDSNPLPASLDISVTADYAHPDSLEKIKLNLMSNSGLVEDVAYQKTQVDVLNRNFRAIALGIAVFSFVLLLIAVALINNTIRLSLFSSRFLIKSMQLVGATRGFIRRPFLRRGILHGLMAGVLAATMLSVVLISIDRRFPELGQLADVLMLTGLYCGILFFGILLSGISTLLSVNKYLKLSSAELY